MTTRHHATPRLVSLLLVAALLLGSLLPAAPLLAQQESPAQTEGSPAVLPALRSVVPEAGASWKGEPVVWRFDRWVSIAGATIAPGLDGAWQVSAAEDAAAGSTVTFTPAQTPDPGVRYRLRFTAFAVAEAGQAGVAAAGEAPEGPGLSVEHLLAGAVPLAVTATTPSNGAVDIAAGSAIVVTFNRPIVPLVGAGDQSDLPQPLTIDPPVEGTGRWLTTSIYAFTPGAGLAGATDYTVTVEPLTAVGGEALADAYVFTFSTTAPVVESWRPEGPNVSPSTSVQVSFSQPMDRPSTEAAFALRVATAKGASSRLPGRFAWDELSRTLTFTPTGTLVRGESYDLEVADSAQPATGSGGLREAFSTTFTVAPLPAVVGTIPQAGAEGVIPDQQITIRLSAPMSRSMLLDAISITPLLTTTTVYSWYSEWDGEVTLEWQKQADTTYTITIDADAEDLYGVKLGKSTVLTFTTGDFSPFVRMDLEKFTHFTPYTETNVSLFYRNVDELEVALYRLPLSEYVNAFSGPNAWDLWERYQPLDSWLLWTRTYTATATRNETYQRVITLDDGEGNILPPGLYLAATQQPPVPGMLETEQPTPAINIVAISSNAIVLKKSFGGQSLAWVTDAGSGEPVPGVEVRFEHASGTDATAVTGDDGVALATFKLSGESSWLPLVAWVGQPGDEAFAIASSEWNQGIAPWDFNISGGYGPDEYQSIFYTDRPLYRAGQTVYWKGIVRHLLNDTFQIPDVSIPMSITVRNDRGDAILAQRVNFSENGTLSGEVLLPPDAFSGYYYIEALLPLGGENVYYAGTGFQVAAYVKPEFEVRVIPEPAEVTQGDTVRVRLEADYFSGGALANAPLTWRVIARPYDFFWADAPDGRWFSFTPWDPERENYDPYAFSFYGLVKEGAGSTDANGDYVLELPADLGAALQSQQWTVDFTVQSPTNQFVNEAAEVIVHRGDFYVGLSPRSYVATAGEETAIDVVALSPDGTPVAGQPLEATIYEFRWNSVQEQAADGSFIWTSTSERTAVDAQTLTTGDDGMALLTFAPPRGGQYQIVVAGEDEAGNAISSALFIWASDPDTSGYTPWQRENNDRIELVADLRSYQPGDTARILVPSPFQGETLALVTLERTGVVEHRLVTLESNSETLEVPITEEHVPNLFVGVVLIKGIDETNPAPAIRIGYVQLNVGTDVKELAIDVEVDTGNGAAGEEETPTALPGAPVTYTLHVADATGAPAAGVEVSVALVDKALLSLAADYTPTLIDTFYRTRPLGITTGGTLIVNRDRMAQQLSEGAKGGGGGGDGMGMLEVREEFPDTALWRATLVSDEEGRIQFSLNLPDNLTTWMLAARAVTQETLVGEAKHELVVSKPLQVRPLLPRFFTAGDRARLGAVILNTSGEAIESAVFTITVEGATLEGKTTRTLDFGSGGDGGAGASFSRVNFDVSIPNNTDAVTVTLYALAQSAGADGEELGDAVRRVLPVVRYTTPEVVGSAGSAAAAGVIEQVLVPDEATDEGALIVGVEPSLAAGMTQGLDYLRHFPWECNEQTVSRFLPNLFTARAVETLGLVELGLAPSALVGDLAFHLGAGVQALVARQNADGGWGNWPGEQSNRFVTAYALWGLWNAAEAGREVPDFTIDRAVEYLDRHFVAPEDALAGNNSQARLNLQPQALLNLQPQALLNLQPQALLNSLAFVHFVLADMGEGDPGRMSTLYDLREQLDHYGRALLAMAMAAESPDDPRVQTLLDDLQGAAIQTGTATWWQENEVDLAGLNTDVRTTAIVLAAFSRLRPDAPLLPNVVRWLMQAREAGIWSNTQENAWALIALTDWMVASGELEADYTWTVTLNGDTLGEGEANPATLLDRVELRAAVSDLLRGEANAVAFERSNDTGRMDYTLHLEYFLDALAISAADHGIVVDRAFTINGEPATTAKVGDIISVTVTVVAPTLLHQLLVEVPVPAGTEILDPNLAGNRPVDMYGSPIPLPDWESWMPTYRDFRDDRVALFDSALPPGTWQYTFHLRATVPGEFRVLPARAEMLYFREVWGRSSGSLFTVSAE